MFHRPEGLFTGALALLIALALVPAAGATPASVRIVGDGVGAEAAVDTTGGTFGPDACPGDSAGGAIDKAVAGNWDQKKFVETILGESHTYVANDYWTFWINDTFSAAQGICDYIVQPGDRVLIFVQRDGPGFVGTVFPLTLSAPTNVIEGTPFTVTVNEQRTDGTTTTPTPIAGATVAAGGASALTDAAGKATLTIATAGATTLRATHAGNVSSAAVAISVLPAGTTPPAVVADRAPPVATILGIADGKRFARGAGPRTLQVRVAPDPSGLLTVKLRLTRTDRGRCTYFSGKAERFRLSDRGRCGASHGFWFAVGEKNSIDYLLPSRLPRGRYVLDVKAIDKAFNGDDVRRRGSNRVVFRVG